MIPNLYMENGCFTKHPLKTGCLGFQETVTLSKGTLGWSRFDFTFPIWGHLVSPGNEASKELPLKIGLATTQNERRSSSSPINFQGRTRWLRFRSRENRRIARFRNYSWKIWALLLDLPVWVPKTSRRTGNRSYFSDQVASSVNVSRPYLWWP